MPTSSAVATFESSAGGRPGASFSPAVVAGTGPWHLARMRTALVLLLLAAAAPARAQTLGTPLPIGMDLRKAPVGAWSEYTVTVADLPPLKQRFAVVARDAATHSVEMTSEGG